jgi:4-amino-4-deoxy-L-arabinose transferase-like glycosyltransferase
MPVLVEYLRKLLRSVRQLLVSPTAIICAALIARFIYLYVFFHSWPAPANHFYKVGYETGSIAESIAAGRGYSSPLSTPSGPTAWITPIYPLLLAGVFKIFGIFTFSSSLVIRLLDVAFASATCLPILALGKRLFSAPVGAAAAWIWAFLPYSIFYSVSWVWDTSLSALMLSIAIWATYALEETDRVRTWAGFGFLWGFAVLVNAAILSVFPGSLAFAAYRARQRGVRWAKLSGIAAIVFAATLVPWIIRNQVVFHGQVFLRSNFGLELWLGNNPDVPDSWTGWLHPNENGEERQKYLSMGELPYMQEKQRTAFAFMKSHPGDVLRFEYHRVLETWTGNKDAFLDIFRIPNWQVRGNLLINYSLALLTFIGLFAARRKLDELSWPLLNTIFVFPIVYYVCHSSPRYRHPIDPVMAILSAYAVTYCAQLVGKRKTMVPAMKQAPEIPAA